MELIVLEKVEQVGISLLPAAEQKRDRLIVAASEITSVANADQQEEAVDCMRRIKTLLNSVEEARKQVKGPVLTLGKRIDDIAKSYCERVNQQFERLTGLVNDYQKAERERVAEAERKRQAEVDRLKQQEEQARLDLAKAEKAASKRNAGLSEAEQAALAEDNLFQAARAVAVVSATPLPVTVAKTSGMITRPTVEFEITDKEKLYSEKPHWFDLVPKRSVIRLEITKETNLPGLRVWEETKIGVRS